MDESTVASQPTRKSVRMLWFVLSGIIILIFLLIIYSVMMSITTVRESSDSEGEFGGHIYLTLAPLGSRTADIYKFSIEDKTLSRFIQTSADGFDREAFTRHTSSISPSSNEIAYMMAEKSDDNSSSDDQDIEYGFTTGGPLTLITFPLSNQNDWHRWLATSSVTGIRTNPEWSPNNEVIALNAFTPDEDVVAFNNPIAWSIYIATRNNGERYLTRGSYPKWTPDGNRILYIGADGLYIQDVNVTDPPERVLSISDALLRSDYFDISLHTDSMIIGTDGLILLYDVESWETLHFSLKGDTMNSGHFYKWPTFSHDGRYVAALRYQSESPDADLVVLDTSDLSREWVLKTLPSTEFDPAIHFISDWR